MAQEEELQRVLELSKRETSVRDIASSSNSTTQPSITNPSPVRKMNAERRAHLEKIMNENYNYNELDLPQQDLEDMAKIQRERDEALHRRT